MRVFLGFMTWANARNREHSASAFILFFIIAIAAFTVPIFYAENWDSSKLLWIPNMIGGGIDFPDAAEMIPKTTIGVILIGILPLASIALLVKLMAALNNNKTIEDIAFKLATGEIQSHRVVVIMDKFQKNTMEFIGNILKTKNNTFVTIIINQDDKTEVQEFLNNEDININTNDDYYIEFLSKGDPADVACKFNMEKADEIYLFSEPEIAKKIANSLQIRLLIDKKLKLKDKERYPKIFAKSDIFSNKLINENYVIDLPMSEALKAIQQEIYNNDLAKNDYKTLKQLVNSFTT